MPTGSTPPCSKKSRSSAASTACDEHVGQLVVGDVDPVLLAAEAGDGVVGLAGLGDVGGADERGLQQRDRSAAAGDVEHDEATPPRSTTETSPPGTGHGASATGRSARRRGSSGDVCRRCRGGCASSPTEPGRDRRPFDGRAAGRLGAGGGAALLGRGATLGHGGAGAASGPPIRPRDCARRRPAERHRAAGSRPLGGAEERRYGRGGSRSTTGTPRRRSTANSPAPLGELGQLVLLRDAAPDAGSRSEDVGDEHEVVLLADRAHDRGRLAGGLRPPA